MGELNCENGDDCKTEYTCGGMYACGLGAIECISKHYRHDCAHDWNSGPWVEYENGGSVSCKCGVTSADHDMMHGP